MDDTQLAQIKEEGLFVVPSRQYPGRFHVWRVSSLIQKGRKNIEISWNEHRKASIDAITVRLPARIWGERPLSIRRGMRNIMSGLWQIAGLVVGTTETVPAYTEQQIAEILHRESLTHARDKLSGQGIDLTPYSQAIEVRAAPFVQGIVRTVEEEWNKSKPPGYDAEYARAREEFASKGFDQDAIAYNLRIVENEAQIRLVDEALRKSEPLEGIYPGLGAIYANRMQAMKVILSLEDLFVKEMLDAYPVESERTAAFSEKWTAFLPQIVQALESAGFITEARIVEAQINYYAEELEERWAGLSDATDPKGTFEFHRPIWLRSGWKVDGSKERGFHLERYQWSEVPTKGLWRLKLFAERSRYFMANGLHGLIVSNLWNGPLGLKSMSLNRPFQNRWGVDQETGQIVPNGRPQQTLISRVLAQYQIRREILQSFSERNNFGFFGKNAERALLFFKADLWHGALAPGLIGLLQPVATAANISLTAAGSAAVIVGAPIASLSISAWNMLIADSDHPGGYYRNHAPKLSLINLALFKTAVCGVGQCVASAAAAVIHAGGTVGHLLVGAARTAMSKTWDAGMRLLIKPFARVPGRDSRPFVKRVSGPGLVNDYYFQVDPALVTLVTWASIETSAVFTYEEQMTKQIRSPVAKLEEFESLLSVLTGGTLEIDAESPAGESVMASVDRQLDSLKAALKSRLEHLKQMRVSKGLGDDDLRRIRLTRKQLDEVRKQLTYLIEVHPVGKKIASLANSKGQPTAEVIDSWLSYAFHSSILTPLEVTDKTFLVNVEEPRLSDRMNALMEGRDATPAETLVDAPLEKPAAPAPLKKVHPPIHSPGDLCESNFVSPLRLRHRLIFE